MEKKLMPYRDLVQDYEYWKKDFLRSSAAKNLSTNTINNYEKAFFELEEFLRGYNGELQLADINRPVLENFIIHLRDNRNLSDSTIHTHLTIVKSFLRHISEENRDQVDLTVAYRRIKIKREKKIPSTLTRNEAYRLLEHVEEKAYTKRDYLSVRDSLIVKLLLFTGMRVSSLLNLKMHDFAAIEYDGEKLYEIHIMQKGRKENRVYIIADEISWELERLKELGIQERIFFSKSFKELDRIGLYKRLESLFRKVGIMNKKGIHIFRHTFVKFKREEGVDLSTIKALLGHSSITTTIHIYGAANEADKKRAALSREKNEITTTGVIDNKKTS